jgi:AraC-like DNA-binding protein
MKGGRIGNAAEASGFLDANYFSRWFRQQTGLSPTAFVNSSIRPRSTRK